MLPPPRRRLAAAVVGRVRRRETSPPHPLPWRRQAARQQAARRLCRGIAPRLRAPRLRPRQRARRPSRSFPAPALRRHRQLRQRAATAPRGRPGSVTRRASPQGADARFYRILGRQRAETACQTASHPQGHSADACSCVLAAPSTGLAGDEVQTCDKQEAEGERGADSKPCGLLPPPARGRRHRLTENGCSRGDEALWNSWRVSRCAYRITGRPRAVQARTAVSWSAAPLVGLAAASLALRHRSQLWAMQSARMILALASVRPLSWRLCTASAPPGHPSAHAQAVPKPPPCAAPCRTARSAGSAARACVSAPPAWRRRCAAAPR